MKLVLAGGSGFIGRALCNRLIEQGHSLTLLTRSRSPAPLSPGKTWVAWNPDSAGDWQRTLDAADGVINLAGEPIAGKRWTAAQKRKIRSSRINTTRALVTAIDKTEIKPKFLLNASAIGYYGARGDEVLTEESVPGNDFLSSVCAAWEQEAEQAAAYGLRVIRLRTGIVLGNGGGALAKMVLPFKLFVGGPLGSGTQWMPWIHLEDEIDLIQFLIENRHARGAVNATAPYPVTMREFCNTLGGVLHRPSWAPVPAFALRLLLGEMAEILLASQRVIPAKAQSLGYQFKHPTLLEALRALLA
ncbi:MAG: TIGR01777 family protein [Deltaproteobacteria bacterium RIFCSPLOWO2_12_FULL_60_19]|nr:MAG: TIGR01777 family protein [Deltaproteobacteria bacterium RIFCSPLOWO2_12_FULL_60_19]